MDQHDGRTCFKCDKPAMFDGMWYGSYCEHCNHLANEAVYGTDREGQCECSACETMRDDWRTKNAPRTCDTLIYPETGGAERCGAQSVVSVRPKGMDIPTRYCREHAHLMPEAYDC